MGFGIEVVEDTYLNFTVNVSCTGSDCGDIEVSLMIPVLEEVKYFHDGSLGVDNQDCFDESSDVCVTRGSSGSPYNAGTESVSIGWGDCNNVSDWYAVNNNGWKAIKNEKLGGGQNMPLVVGHDLCFDAGELGMWDVVFSVWDSDGNFEYTRIQERGLVDTEDENPRFVNLNEGEFELVVFSVKASGDVGSDYDFVLLVGDERSEGINVKIIVASEDDEDDESSSSSSRRSRKSKEKDELSDYYKNVINDKKVEESLNPPVQILVGSEITGNVVGYGDNAVPLILVGLIVLLIMAIFGFLLLRSRIISGL